MQFIYLRLKDNLPGAVGPPHFHTVNPGSVSQTELDPALILRTESDPSGNDLGLDL